MRWQTSGRRCSAVSRSIHRSETCSFRAGKALFNDILVLNIDWEMTLQCLWRYRAAERPPSSINGEIDGSATFERNLFGRLSRFAKEKHARLEQEKIFPTTSSVWQSTGNDAGVPVQSYLRKPAIDRPVHKELTKTRSVLGFSTLVRQTRKEPKVKSPQHLKV